ncbi:hypothetical protein [Alicyclobacillus dauci]|uniref:HTH merR-type domain-containing protein n=1 Tax=Alicyclobacillus dauci TaxID=1475485 RepID=A0ABY6Z1J8_9BACL|nr:hypothetical protein [Alicyclobacillus dauci]WAH36773.1 hypothetical protein NZD86_21790 [Alicyclobacillus dauci]
MEERYYRPAEISAMLSIGHSTLRKWCVKLEDSGYSFLKDDRGRRVFAPSDVTLFQDMKGFLNHQMNMEDAAQASLLKCRREGEVRPRTLTLIEREQSSVERSLDEIVAEAADKFWSHIHGEMEQHIRSQVRQEMQEQLAEFEERLEKQYEHQVLDAAKEIAVTIVREREQESKSKRRFFGLF